MRDRAVFMIAPRRGRRQSAGGASPFEGGPIAALGTSRSTILGFAVHDAGAFEVVRSNRA